MDLPPFNAPHISTKKLFASLYSRYYAEACNKWWGPSPWHSARVTQLRRNIAMVASRWQQYVRFDGVGLEPKLTAPTVMSVSAPTGYLFLFFIVTYNAGLLFLQCSSSELSSQSASSSHIHDDGIQRGEFTHLNSFPESYNKKQ